MSIVERIPKQHPMLAADSVARNLAEGWQTQDRRPLKVQPVFDGDPWLWRGEVYNECDLLAVVAASDPVKVDDVFFVRECFYIDDLDYIGKPLPKEKPSDFDMRCVYYRGDGNCCQQIPECCCVEVGKPKWRPSIHMPKWLTRTWLRVERRWAERIQSISEADALAEGCDGKCPVGYIPAYRAGPFSYHFAQLWETLYPGSWDRNDVVRCREFVKAERPVQ